jgi:hypothetical protein
MLHRARLLSDLELVIARNAFRNATYGILPLKFVSKVNISYRTVALKVMSRVIAPPNIPLNASATNVRIHSMSGKGLALIPGTRPAAGTRPIGLP